MATISRRAYSEMFGPTKGDRIRLADTELFIEIEKDYATYGEEVKFGGGKVIRDGMGQSQRVAADVMDGDAVGDLALTIVEHHAAREHLAHHRHDIFLLERAAQPAARAGDDRIGRLLLVGRELVEVKRGKPRHDVSS